MATACTDGAKVLRQDAGVAQDGASLSGNQIAALRFFDTPFPGLHRVRADQRYSLREILGEGAQALPRTLVAILEQSKGASLSAGAYFRLREIPPPRLGPAVPAPSDAVVAIRVEGPDLPVVFHPIVWDRVKDPKYGANVLNVRPLSGLPFSANATYVIAVRGTRDSERIGPALDAVLRGESVEGWSADTRTQHDRALAVLQRAGLPREGIASMTVFTTGDPRHELLAARADIALLPKLTLEAPRVIDTFVDYCVFESAITFDSFQEGQPPYATTGGGLHYVDGHLSPTRRERSRVFITVPRNMRTATARTMLFLRVGAGGDRPLVDRGRREVRGGATAPGSGLATEIARAGYVGVTWDGPLGGSRNLDGSDEQLLIFNIVNIVAARANLLASALEGLRMARALESLEVDTRACEGALPRITLDGSNVTLFGHSMGATIAPVLAALEPRVHALVMSGAGTSWIENVVHKESPLPTRPVAAVVAGVDAGYLDETHPILNLLQWAAESADPQVYAEMLLERAPRMLIFQGIRDNYIPLPVANPMVAAFGLDVQGDILDELDDRYPGVDEWLPLAQLRGGGRRNRPGGFGRAVTQVAQDDIEDGHEVLFQTPDARVQFECWLQPC